DARVCPSVLERGQFYEAEGITPAKGYKFVFCKHCSNAHSFGDRSDPPSLIQGRARNYLNHLKNCSNYKDSQSLVGVTPLSGSKRPRSYESALSDTPEYYASQKAPGTGRKRLRYSLGDVEDESPNPERSVLVRSPPA
ncbi:hypothetical protein L915_06313, partial [Phytophthora nicotianae]